MCIFSPKVENVWGCVCHGMGTLKKHNGHIWKVRAKLRREGRSIEQCGNYETEGDGCAKKLSLAHEWGNKPDKIVESN